MMKFKELNQKQRDIIQILSEEGFRVKCDALGGYKVSYKQGRSMVEIRDRCGIFEIHTVSTGFGLNEATTFINNMSKCRNALAQVAKKFPDKVDLD